MKKQLIFLLATIAAVTLVSCDSSSEKFEDISDAVTLAEDEIFALKSAESTDSDVNAARFSAHLFRGGMMIGGRHLFFGKHFPDCTTVTVISDEFPKDIIIDYGDGCTGRGGIEKKGVITLSMTDTITSPGATYSITFEDMSIGNRQVEKSAIITNDGLNSDELWVISSVWTMTSTMVSEGTTVVVTREYSEQKTWISGFETPEVEDDEFIKTGGGSITVNDEIKYERTVTDALVIDRECMFPLSGVIEITRDGEQMTIDFGDGDCDNIAVVTKGDESEEIELISGRFRRGFQRGNRHMRQKNGWL